MPSMVPSIMRLMLKEFKNSLVFRETVGYAKKDTKKKEERFMRMNCLVVQHLPSHGASIGDSGDCK